MISTKRLAAGAAWAALLCATSAAYAQETTGSMRGQVSDEAGAPVAGATVTVKHTPSGTTTTAVTSASGFYNVRGLRVGGPYAVTVAGQGFRPAGVQVANVGIGDPAAVDLVVEAGSGELSELVVTAAPGGGETSSRGLGSRYGAAEIQELPQIGRDPKEIARINPFVTLEASNNDALIVAGTHPRFNSLTVDGITQNDDFGLNTAGYPTQRSPISLDALAAIEVNVAPYSVEYNKFTGGNINAVTRSGDNEFHGSLFYEFSNEDMAASKQANRFGGRSATSPYESKVWGATLGGPIVKDRLFFFGSYEKGEFTNAVTHGPADLNRLIAPGAATSAQIAAVQDALSSLYGFDYDSENSILSDTAFVEDDEKWLGRVDWNINDDHRAAFTYQLTEGARLLPGDTPSASSSNLPLLSNYYDKNERLETYGLQVFSNWTDNFSTEVNVSRKEVESNSVPVAGCSTGPIGNGDEACEFGQVEISQSGSTLWAGPDRSRHANVLTNELTTYGVKGEYTLGDHTFLLGYQREDYEAYNLFAQQSEGRFNFASLADFQAGRASRIRYQQAFRDANGDGAINELDAGINLDYKLNSLYAQDTFEVTPELTLLAGVRYEWYQADGRPNRNQNFYNRYAFWNDETLEGRSVVLPRFSVDWRPEEDLRISAGLGLFSGGSPNVWVGNSFSNDGTTLALVDCTRTAPASASCPAQVAAYLDNVLAGGGSLYDVPPAIEGLFDPSNPAFATNVINANTNAIDPHFEPVSSWKASVSVDKRVSFGEADWQRDWDLGVDVLLTKVENGVTWLDYRAGRGPCGVGPDGRPVYLGSALCAQPRVGTGQNDLVLTNSKEGHNNAVAFRINKSFDFGLNGSFSYTNTDAEDVNPALSSVAFSNWSNNATSDVNGMKASRSNYEIEHSSKLTLSYERKFFGDNATRITLFGEYRSGYPYSVVYGTATGFTGTNIWGDGAAPTGAFTRQLVYVPLEGADPVVRFADAATAQAFNDYVRNSALNGYRGQIAPRNLFTAPYVTRIDLRISQETPAFFPGGSKLELFMDIKNLANLLNEDWGVQEQVEFAYMSAIVDVGLECSGGGAVAGGACPAGQTPRYVYSNFRKPTLDTANTDAPRRSSWQIKVGAKYRF